MKKAKDMALTLLKVGATSSQADLNGITAFHYYVHHGTEAMLTLFDNDKALALSALNHVAVSGGMWSSNTSSPLITALENRDSITALKLLDAGASKIDFAVWIKSARTAFENRWNQMNDPENNLKLFLKSVEQPIVLAVEKEQPSLVLSMLTKGADPNTMTKTANLVLQEEYQRNYNRGETLLDFVRKKLDQLRKFEREPKLDSPPEPLKDDEGYLSGLEKGTYKYWVASTELKNARSTYERQFEAHQNTIKEANKKPAGLEKKHAAIDEMIVSFEKVERELLELGAKTFEELYPDIKDLTHLHHHTPYERPKPKPFEVTFSFAIGELTEELKELYLTLYVVPYGLHMAILIIYQFPGIVGW
jgi:hypothetical protein